MEGEQLVNQEIADLERQLREKREQLSNQQAEGQLEELPHEKETLHEVVREKITEGLVQAGSGQTQPPITSTPAVEFTEEMKLQAQELVNTAFSGGIDQAINKARATNNAALIDAFHDLLVDELYNHLVERGKLKQF